MLDDDFAHDVERVLLKGLKDAHFGLFLLCAHAVNRLRNLLLHHDLTILLRLDDPGLDVGQRFGHVALTRKVKLRRCGA